MAFLSYEITGKQAWWQVEDGGTSFYPCEYFTKAEIAKIHDLDLAEEDDAERIAQIKGYGARLSASVYLDCTEWGVYESRAAAKAALDEMFGDDEADDEAAALGC
jgi:hypothetical protein